MTNKTPPPRKPKVFKADDPDLKVVEPKSPDAEYADVSGPDAFGSDPHQQASADGSSLCGDASSQDNRFGPATSSETTPSSRGRWGWGGVLVGALVSLFTLALGLWFSSFVATAITRDDWVGYLAFGLAAMAAFAAAVLALREIFGIWRLSRLTGLRKDAEHALRADDLKAAQRVSRRLKSLAGRPRDKRWDLTRFREEERHMRSGTKLLGLADRVLLAPADREAKTIVYESARRVAIVTAIVPIAFVVVLFVLFENLRMTRRLAGAYGGRPGFLGGLRLFWWIVTHLAATGAIALTDDLFGQFLGQDVARRVSRRLGEGAFNGAMTARLGVAAIALTRPLPFIEAQPPRIRSILVELFPEINPTELVSSALRGARPKDNQDNSANRQR
ncbi:MAG: TIGR01620 family protein [Pseudomonadota bacterium]